MDLKLADFLRFGSSGSVAFVYLYFLYPDAAQKLNATSGPIALPLILIVVSSVIYFTERITVLPTTNWLQDKFFNCYRYLIKNGNDLTTDEAESVYSSLRIQGQLNLSSDRNNWASGIHLLYQSSLVGVAFFLYSVFERVQSSTTELAILISAVLFYLVGFFNDVQMEKRETIAFLKVKKPKIDEAVRLVIRQRKII